MPRLLRWQVVLALIGGIAIAVLISLFATRTFVDRPSRGGQVVEAVVGQPAVINPLFAAKDVEVDLARLVFAGLTRPASDGSVAPDLATRWDVGDDGRTYTFTLRDGLTWHDGAPVTADDVVFTADLAAEPRLRPSLTRDALAWSRAEVEKVNELTVRFTLPEPLAPFLATTGLGILPAHLLGDVPATDVAGHRFSTIEPVGAGPFEVTGPGGFTESGARLARFADHWEASDRQPFLEGLELLFADDPVLAAESLGQHAVQIAGGLTGSSVNDLTEAVSLYHAAQPGYALVYLNLDRVLYSDARVRQALSVAADRESLVADPAVLDGQGLPAAGPISPGSWAFPEGVTAPVHDLVAARKLLDESGWIDSDGNGVRDREGQSLDITLGVGPDPTLVATANRLHDTWSAIGVDVTVRNMDAQSVRQSLTDRTYDAMLFRWDLQDYDPDPFPLWHSSQIPNGQSFSGWSNAEADALLVEARQTHDQEARAALYDAFTRLFVVEQPAVILYHPMYTLGVAAGEVGGVQVPQLVVHPADRYITLRDWFVETERVVLEDE